MPSKQQAAKAEQQVSIEPNTEANDASKERQSEDEEVGVLLATDIFKDG